MQVPAAWATPARLGMILQWRQHAASRVGAGSRPELHAQPSCSICTLHASRTSERAPCIPRLELKRPAAFSSSLACSSFSLLLLHCSQPAHSDELPLRGGRRHSALVARRRKGSLQLVLEVELEA